MKPTSHNNSIEDFALSILAFIASIIQSAYSHIDGWAIVQSVLCAVAGFYVVRFLRKYHKEK